MSYDQELMLQGLMGLGGAWDKSREMNQGASPAQRDFLGYLQSRMNGGGGPGLDQPSPTQAHSPAFPVVMGEAPSNAMMNPGDPGLDAVRPSLSDVGDVDAARRQALVHRAIGAEGALRAPPSSPYAAPLPPPTQEARPAPPRLKLDLSRMSRQDAAALTPQIIGLGKADDSNETRKDVEDLKARAKAADTATKESGKDKRQKTAHELKMEEIELKAKRKAELALADLEQKDHQHAENIAFKYYALEAAKERLKIAQEAATERTSMSTGADERIAAQRVLVEERGNVMRAAAQLGQTLGSLQPGSPHRNAFVQYLDMSTSQINSTEATQNRETMNEIVQGEPARGKTTTTTKKGPASSASGATGGGAVGAQPKSAPTPAPSIPAPAQGAAPKTAEEAVYGENRPKQGAAPAASPAPKKEKKKLTDEEKKALSWAKSNRNDERAKKILAMYGES